MDNQAPCRTPRRVADISREWLEQALVDVVPAPVQGFTAIPIGSGFYGSMARIDIRGAGSSEERPLRVIAKFPAEDEDKRAALRALGIYDREYRFYKKLGGRLPVRTPMCYFAEVDPETGDSVLLLEHLEGRVFDDVRGATFQQAQTAFRTAADLHSATAGDSPLDVSWLQRLGAPPVLDMLVSATEAGAAAGADRLRECAPDWMIRNATRGHRIVHRQLSELDRLPRSFIHIDYRLSNMIFSDQPPGSFALVDFHSAHSGPGVVDLAYFASIALTVTDRREWEDELVRDYLRRVQGWTGRERPAWFETAWRRMILFLAFNCIRNAAVLDMEDQRTREFITAWVERISAMAEDHNAVEMLDE